MSYLANAGAILIEVAFSLAMLLFVLRVLLQWVRANFHNPICQFFYKATNPLLMPMRRALPPIGRIDSAGVLVSFLLALLKLWLLTALGGLAAGLAALLVLAVAELLGFVLSVFFWLIVVRAILSFVAANGYHPAYPLLMQLTEPLLQPLRRLMPALGPFDLSPLVATLVIVLARVLLVAPLSDWGMALARGG